MDIMDLVNDKLMIVIPVLWFISKTLKETPFVKNWIIPWVTAILGILFCALIDGINVQSVMQGILCSGIALFGSFFRKNLPKE